MELSFMPFEWDSEKNDINVGKHKICFDDVTAVFDGPTLEAEDTREDYGEPRIGAIGAAGDFVFYVVYTWRGQNRRIISARLANRKERKMYAQSQK
jgi:uncharacterized protein